MCCTFFFKIIAGVKFLDLNTIPWEESYYASTDVLAVDTIASYFTGFTLQKIPHLRLAVENGLGEYRMERIETVSANIHEIRMDFDNPFPKD